MAVDTRESTVDDCATGVQDPLGCSIHLARRQPNLSDSLAANPNQ